MAISKIPASRVGIPELALTADEAQIAAVSINQILEAFVPDVATMSPKTAAVISGAVALGSIGFDKYSIYIRVRTAQAAEAAKQPEPVSEVQNVTPNGATVESYFGRKSV